MSVVRPRLSLGPISYFWSADQVRDFYADVARWPVDIVYLGETVCSKRRALGPEDWLSLSDDLSSAGKEVVISTLALIEAGSEVGALESLCGNGRYTVEANDMGAVQLLAGSPGFVAGPHINAYNQHTLGLLAGLGVSRWVMPVEVSQEILVELQKECPPGLETEVFVFGRMPLAFSARCFTARAHNVGKDECEFRCKDYPNGQPLLTQEDQPLFTINGIQLQSATPCNLLAAAPSMREMGIDVLRISPLENGTEEAVRAFRDVLDGTLTVEEGEKAIEGLAPEGWCNGYWYGEAGMVWQDADLDAAVAALG